MTHNLTITVSDELWDKIEKWRERLALARLCQEAIGKEIEKLESVPKIADELEATITRLRQEAKEWEKESRLEGYAQGIEWAKEASFADLNHFAKLANELVGQVLLPGQNLIPDDEWDIKRGRQSAEGVEWDDDEYQFGWLDGAREFWNKVADNIRG